MTCQIPLLGCNVRLFADDAILYKEISSQEDGQSLQKDLDKVAEWSWKMKLQMYSDVNYQKKNQDRDSLCINDTPLELVTLSGCDDSR